MLSYQRLDVYRCGIRLVVFARQLADAAPRGFADLADQLRRAAASVPLNIAEGSGRASTKERAQYLAIARGSAMECGAIIDTLAALGCRHRTAIDEATALTIRIVEMLTKMNPPTPT